MFFFQLQDETTVHLFANCVKTNTLWANIKEFFNGKLKLPSLTSQCVIFDFSNVDQDIFLVSIEVCYYLRILFIFQETPIYSCFRDFLEISRKHTLQNKTQSQDSERKKKQFHKKIARNSEQIAVFQKFLLHECGVGVG